MQQLIVKFNMLAFSAYQSWDRNQKKYELHLDFIAMLPAPFICFWLGKFWLLYAAYCLCKLPVYIVSSVIIKQGKYVKKTRQDFWWTLDRLHLTGKSNAGRFSI